MNDSNPFLFVEKLWSTSVINTLDAYRDMRDAMYEAAFLGIYSSPTMLRLGEPFAFERTRKDPKALRFLPEVQAILLGVDRGGFEEAVIRMLILMAESRATVRRDRLERSAKVLGHDEPFASLGPERRALLIREQSILVEFEPDLAVKTLPDLLPQQDERRRAIQVVEFIAGAIEEMEPSTIQMLQRFHSVLGLPGLALPSPTQDPLKASTNAQLEEPLEDVMTTVATTVDSAKEGSATFEAVNAEPEVKARKPKAKEVA